MTIRSVARIAPLVLAAGLLTAAGSASTTTASAASPGAAACEDTHSAARVKPGAKAQEPELYPKNEANAWGVIKDRPRLANGSVHIRTVFHMVGEDAFTTAEKARWTTMINAQMKVLNDAYAGKTATTASNTPFRFDLDRVTWTVNPAWYHVEPGKKGAEREMKNALYEGDSTTLNVYAADIGGGLLGWAYFPSQYNNGHDIYDGVVMLDESMPGGTAGKYAFGDTLTHEVGHWLMLEHTFRAGCSAAGDFVADTPPEAIPQFDCPIGADTCTAPGDDPIHNFMDYSQDTCMNEFTPGQAERMSDAWRQFRAKS